MQQLQEQEEAISKAIIIINDTKEKYNTHIQDIQNRLKNKLRLDNKTIQEITKFEEDYFINQYNSRGIKTQTNTLTR